MAKDKRHMVIKNEEEDDDKKKKIMVIIAIIIIVLALLSSCSCTSNFFGVIGNLFRNEGNYEIGDDPEEETIKNKELKFLENKLEINLGDTKAKLGFYYKNISPTKFTCVTSDADIASCYVEDDYVVINPYKAGKVTVYLRTNANGKKYEASAKVTINDSDRGIKLLETEGTLNLAYEKVKNVAYTLDGITGVVTATSSDDSIAKATIENGVLKVTAYKAGTVKITLNINYNGTNYTSIYTLNVINQIGTQSTGGSTGSGSSSGSGNTGNSGNSGNLVESDFDSDSLLISLTTNKGDLGTFKPNDFEYNINVGWLTGNITLNAVAKYGKLSYQYKRADQNKFSDVDSLKNLKLKNGVNTVKIIVTSKDGKNTSTYIVYINKETGNYLKNIESDDIDIDFKKKTQEYTVKTDKDVVSLKVTKDDKDQEITYTFGGTPVESLNNLKLSSGTNTIQITVKHPEDKERVYTINVIQEKNGVDNDSSLSSLTDTLGKITGFDANDTKYNISLANDVTDFNLTAGATSDNATVTIKYNGNEVSSKKAASMKISDIPVGKSTVEVIVKNGEKTTTYTITVDRAKNAGEEGNNRLTSLEVKDGKKLEPEFNPDEHDYKIFVGNDKKVSIEAATGSNSEISYCIKDKCDNNEWTDGSKININDLAQGNTIIKIRVKEKGSSSTDDASIYNIIVNRAGSSVAELEKIIINGTEVSVTDAATEEGANVEIDPEGSASLTATSVNNGTVTYYDSNSNKINDINKYLTNLAPGTSATIKIKVESENGEKSKEYTVNVTKKEKGEEPPVVEDTDKAEFKKVPTCTLGSECEITYVIYDKDGNEYTTSYKGDVTAAFQDGNIIADTSALGIIKFTPEITSTKTQELTLTLSTGHTITTKVKFERPSYNFNVQSDNGNIYANVPGVESADGKTSLIVYADIFDTRPIENVVEENGVLKIYGDNPENAYITVSDDSDLVTLSYDKHNTDDSTYLPIKIAVNKDQLDAYLAANPSITEPTFNITVKGNLYGGETTKTISLKVSRNYTIIVDAGDGKFTENVDEDGNIDNIRTIPLQRGKSYNLSTIETPYVISTENEENACVKITKVFKQYLDENGNPISEIQNITSDRRITVEYEDKKDSSGNDDYPVKTFWLTLDGNDENGLFYTKERANSNTFFPENTAKYNKKLIYPGISGSYAMNITNTLDSKKTIVIKGLVLEEQTICVEDGCVNMGFEAKSGSGNKPETSLEGGVTHLGDDSKSDDSEKYVVLNSVNSGNSTNSTITVRESTRDLQNHKGTNKIDIKFAEDTNVNTTLAYEDYITITLHWKWIETNDKLDTAIGTIVNQMDEDDNIYSIKVGIQYIEICE